MNQDPGGHLSCLTSIGIPVLKIRQSHNCLIFNMGIPIPGKDFFILRQDPGHQVSICYTHYFLVPELYLALWMQVTIVLYQQQKHDSFYYQVSFLTDILFACIMIKLFLIFLLAYSYNTVQVEESCGLLSKISSRKYTMPKITFMVGISSWNFVCAPKAIHWAH